MMHALILAAAIAAHVHPFGPTSDTPVDVHYVSNCVTNDHTIVRDGSQIHIERKNLHCQPFEPVPLDSIVRLPDLLPPGEYHVELHDEFHQDTESSVDFLVRNAAPQPFGVHPVAVPAAGLGLRMRIDGVVCPTSNCEGYAVRVGGVLASPLARSSDGAIWFTAPPHAKGLVDVTVEMGDVVLAAHDAVYYYAGTDRSVFERVLFPVLFHTRGLGDSEWVSGAVLSNPNPWFIENANTIQRDRVCGVYPCGERLAPGLIEHYGEGFPHGAALLVPRGEADSLAFALRIRDISRAAEGSGTRVPVVREKDMMHGFQFVLPNVPRDPRYRVKVRLYAFDALECEARECEGGIRDSPVHMTRSCDTCADEPYYGELDLPPTASGDSENVLIVPPAGSLAWAFATVTNNETQEVTVITPGSKH